MGSMNYDYPTLTNWQDLERLAVDLFSEIYNRPFQRWGRSGQNQSGLDVYAMMPSGKGIVVQCKGKSQPLGKALETKDVDDVLKAIKKVSFEIEEIFLLTTAPDDAKIQDYAASLSRQRLQDGQCAIHVWGWGTICDQINLYEKVQKAHFGHWFKRISIHQWVGLIAAVGVVTTASAIFGTGMIEDRNINRQQQQASVRELQTFVKLAEDLKKTHGKCLQQLESQPFSFQAEFRKSCTEPVSAQLKGIEQQVQKLAPSLASEAWTEINQLTQLMVDDYRQAEVAADMTKSFESEVIQGMKGFCLKKQPEEIQNARKESVLRAESFAINGQLQYYFTLRDFINPGLNSMIARVLVRSRELSNLPIPDDLVKQANQLAILLQERRAYSYKEPEQPFTLSAVKAMSARDIKFSTKGISEDVENARRLDILSVAPIKVFYGKPNDVEELIACGAFKSSARDLVTKL